jgi:ATP-dependent helicase/nuclease subunit A
VLQLVNALFDPVAGPARFGVSDGKDDITHFPWRATEPGSVELWPLLQPQDHEDEADRWIPKTTRAQVQDPEVHMAEAIAQRISQMVQHDILPSKNRPVQAGDIMVLVRSRTAFIGHLTRALKTRGIDVAGADRMVLLDQLAVQDLLAVAHVAILPEDDLTLACALKSPLLGCTEDDLYDLAVNTPGKADCLWLKLCQHAGAETRLGQAQAIVQGILGKADFMRPFDVLQYLLGPLQGRQKLLARLGLNAEDAIDELLQQALLYEDHEIPSMQGFLHWIGGSKRQIKRDQEASAAHLVRIMTVHGAKGLQAPIVFVPTTAVAPTRKRTNQDNIHWDSPKDGGKPVVMWRMDKKCESALVHKAQQETYERSIAEYNRLLYVAMTRAEDTLILSGWQKKTPQNYDESWYKHIESVFKAWQEQQEKGTMPSGMRLLPVYTEPMPEFTGLLPDDDVAVLRRFCMRKDAVPSDATPAPSAQPVSAETNDVVAPARMMPAGIRAALPAEPSPPSPLVPSRLEDEDAIAVTSPLQHSGRSSYFRGTWIHRLLQFLPDVPPSHRMAAAQKVLHGQRIAPVDAESWIHEVCAVLDMPAWQPLFGSRSVAEVSLVGLVGTFAISGQVDRLYVDDDLVWVVDYKSNRMPAATIAEVPEVYVRQLAAYRQALEKMYPHREVRCSLLWTNTLHLMTLPTEILQKVIL